MVRRLGELAGLISGRVVGDPDRAIHGIRPLPEAEAGDLSFLTSPQYRGEARATRAGALLVAPGAQGEEWPEARGRDLLVADDPGFALARLIETFHPPRRPPAGVHETAVVAGSASIDATAHVGPYAVVGEHSRIEAEAVVRLAQMGGDGLPDAVGGDRQVAEAVVDSLARGERPAFGQEDEEAIYDYLAELFEKHAISDATHARAKALFGIPGIVELTALSGYYGMVAMQLLAHDMPLPEGAKPPLERRG